MYLYFLWKMQIMVKIKAELKQANYADLFEQHMKGSYQSATPKQQRRQGYEFHPPSPLKKLSKLVKNLGAKMPKVHFSLSESFSIISKSSNSSASNSYGNLPDVSKSSVTRDVRSSRPDHPSKSWSKMPLNNTAHPVSTDISYRIRQIREA